MSGNVWEWIDAWYGDYSSSAQTDPKGPSIGALRVFRGGGWYSDLQDCRSSSRNYNTPIRNNNRLGFRLVSPK